MDNETTSGIGHALIWVALLIGFMALLATTKTVEMLEDTIAIMFFLTSVGGNLVLKSQHETTKQKVYVLGETSSSKS